MKATLASTLGGIFHLASGAQPAEVMPSRQQPSSRRARKRFVLVPLLLLGLLLAAGPRSAQAQDTRPAQIEGTVVGPEGESLPGANVILRAPEGPDVGFQMGRTTDASGAFRFEEVEPGQYVIEVSFVGFETYERNLVLAAGAARDLGRVALQSGIELEEVVVQARRRGEVASDVPGSISAISASELDDLVIEDNADLIRQIPGVTLVPGGPSFTQDISIRGQGGGRQDFSEAATGIYRNGIFIAGGGYSGRSFNRLDLFDAASIQTYRGPQGALYGRNAVGGAVNVVTQQPTDELEGHVRYSYEDVSRSDIQAVANVPVVEDRLATRFGAKYIDQNGGFYTDAETGDVLDEQSFLGLRGAVRGQLSESTAATVTVEHFDSEAPSYTILGQRLPTDELGNPIAGTGDPGPFERSASRYGQVDIQQTSAFAELESALGFGTLAGTFVFQNRDGTRSGGDLDSFLGFQGFAETDISGAESEDFQQVGADVRLSSPEAEGRRWTWLVGADFRRYEDDVTLAYEGSSLVPDLDALATQRDAFVEKLTSFSGYGLLGYSFTDALTLTGELRVQTDDKDFEFSREIRDNVVLSTGAVGETWWRVLPTATLDYALTEGQTLYARFATGYRPGGFNSAVDDESFVSYDPEDVTSYEVGWKGDVLNDRVRFSTAAYYMSTRDVQSVALLSESGATPALQNSGDVNIYGLEGEITTRFGIGPGILRFSTGASTNYGEFEDGTEILTDVGGSIERIDLSGARVNRTRDLILNASSFYYLPVGRGLTIFGGGSFQTEQGGFENATGDSGSPDGRQLEDYAMMDMRVGIEGRYWRLSGYADNLWDEQYRLQNVGQNLYFNQPRKLGVSLTVRY